MRRRTTPFMTYACLLLIEDRRTHTCHPSYNTIAAATGLAKNTVMKSVNTLLEMGLITVKTSSYFDKRGMKRKGNNLYTLLPVWSAVDTFHQRQPCVPRLPLWPRHPNCASPLSASIRGDGEKQDKSVPL